MVYRGKPSAGCENCRKAKKRCGLEQPACLRCVKLKKTCSGYRDTTSLQIQDESESVKLKAERQKAAKPQGQTQTQPQSEIRSRSQTPAASQPRSQYLIPPRTEWIGDIPTPSSISSDSTSSSDSTVDLDLDTIEGRSPGRDALETVLETGRFGIAGLTMLLSPRADDVAINYFFKSFTSQNHWEFLQSFAFSGNVDRCLELSIKACGMAALGNLENVVMGRDYARTMYVEALGLLNDALRDPKRSKRDESLIAVAMLGYFENLTCDGRPSIQSWKAHIKGATQLLKLRGKAQFKSITGRSLFRETRAQIMISCIWDDEYPPDFLWDFHTELMNNTDSASIAVPVDELTSLCFDFAILRADMRYNKISDAQAVERASDLERQFIQWQIDATAKDERWRYYELDVDDSEHVWDGKVHAYSGHPAPVAWNTWRSMRIMLAQTQEMLCRKFSFSEAERREQMQYFRKLRRQMTDDICISVPSSLGHASPAFSSPCTLITAYGSIWPLYFAGICALERVGPDIFAILDGKPLPPGQATNAAAVQATWILGRLDYISTNVGLRWADGIAATLKGDFKAPNEIIAKDEKAAVKIREDFRCRTRYLIEEPSPLTDAITEELSSKQRPIWLGPAADSHIQLRSLPDEPLGGFGI